jgi:pellino protein
MISKNRNHSVTYTMSRNHAVVVQYVRDEKTDMFQIGRSSENAIDFIILDTQVPLTPNSSPSSSLLPNSQQNQAKLQQQRQSQSTNQSSSAEQQTNAANQQSTISRFSCRICVDREYPFTARIYAAGFDSSNGIFLGVSFPFFFYLFFYFMAGRFINDIR